MRLALAFVALLVAVGPVAALPAEASTPGPCAITGIMQTFPYVIVVVHEECRPIQPGVTRPSLAAAP